MFVITTNHLEPSVVERARKEHFLQTGHTKRQLCRMCLQLKLCVMMAQNGMQKRIGMCKLELVLEEKLIAKLNCYQYLMGEIAGMFL